MKTKLLFLCLLAGLALPTRANLQAIVTPGYQYPTDGSVPPTYQTLNLLALPTIQIFGTVGGSNTLAPGSVTGVSMADNFVDGVTIVYNGNSPRQIQVYAPGLVNGYNGLVSTNNLFMLNVDTNLFLITTNSIDNTNAYSGGTNESWLTMAPQSLQDTNISPNAMIQPRKISLPAFSLGWGSTNSAVSSNTPMAGLLIGQEFAVLNETNVTLMSTNMGLGLKRNMFTSPLITVGSSGVLYDHSHGLSNTPPVVRFVLVCQTAEQGYFAGDELPLDQVKGGSGNPCWTYGANSTNVWLASHENTISAFPRTATANNTGLTPADWKAKIYAW
jgi:hypothetical protein